MANLKLLAGDVAFSKGGMVTTSGLDYTAQLIENRLKTLYGEWELNKTIGIPWFQDLLRKNYNPNLIYQWIHRTITETPNVTGVRELIIAVEHRERKLLISFVAATIYGETEIKVDL